MHRNIVISVPPESTDALVETLREIDGVASISVRRGESVLPPGDVVSVAALNTAADEVLGAGLEAEKHGPVSVTTSTVDSLIDTEQSEMVRQDEDEASWEEAETAMRRHTRPNLNLSLTALAGGLVGTCAMAASSGVTEATALVAAAVIAPVFEPLARVGLGGVSRHFASLRRGFVSAIVAYGCVIISAILTMLLLRAGGHRYLDEFLRSSTVHEVEHPPLLNLLLSAGGAVAGAVMVAAGRFTVLAGPVVALQLIPSAAVIGAAIEIGHGRMVTHAIARLAVDIGMVLLACAIVFTYKHVRVHGRRPARH